MLETTHSRSAGDQGPKKGSTIAHKRDLKKANSKVQPENQKKDELISLLMELYDSCQ
jgi:hypothetical protein